MNILPKLASNIFNTCCNEGITKFVYLCQAGRRSLHLTSSNRGLEEFFDDKENFQAQSVRVGRPWKKEELRLKGNTDLHKLWYVLLKERNMLMSMEAEYKRLGILMPSPERFEKVEESMENLLDIVAERDRAYNMLETGETGEPRQVWSYNALGMGYYRHQKEHYVPLSHNPRQLMYRKWWRPWQIPYLLQWNEKKRKHDIWFSHVLRRHREKLRKVFPNADIAEEQ